MSFYFVVLYWFMGLLFIRYSAHFVYRVPTGQGKLEKVSEFVWSGKGQGKILFLKSLGKWSWIMQTAGICDFFVSLNIKNIKKQANLRFLLNVQKLEVFRLHGGFASRSPTRASVVCILLHYTVSLPHDIVYRYHFWHLCDRVIVLISSGKLTFHDWKSQGILLQKTRRNPVCNNFLSKQTVTLNILEFRIYCRVKAICCHCSLGRRKSLLTRNMLFLLHWEVEVSMIQCFLLVDQRMCCYQNEPQATYACRFFLF